jgi:hypothetical protein
MGLKLNGWQRLWVFLSGAYSIIIIGYLILNFPTSKDIPPSEVFRDDLNPALRQKLINNLLLSNRFILDLAYKNDVFDDLCIKDMKRCTTETESSSDVLDDKWEYIHDPSKTSLDIYTPNAHVLRFSYDWNLSKEDIKSIVRAYLGFIDKQTRRQQTSMIFRMLFFWAIPVISLYILGWSVVWVYKGFKNVRT